MYNLTVTEAHTFVVGDGRWVVHNGGPCAPAYVKNAKTLSSWAKTMEQNYRDYGTVPTVDEVNEFVNLAQQYGVSIRSDPAHPGTPWNISHLNVGEQDFHVPLPPGHPLAK